MLLMVEKGFTGGLYRSIKRYTKANNKYMKVKTNHLRHDPFISFRDFENLAHCQE